MGNSRQGGGKLRAKDAEAVTANGLFMTGFFFVTASVDWSLFLCSLLLLFRQLPFFFVVKLARISNNKRPTARDDISSARTEKILGLLCFELFFMAGISDVSFCC